MIGTTELMIIGAFVLIFFFGKDKLIEWSKGFGEAKKAYNEAKITETK